MRTGRSTRPAGSPALAALCRALASAAGLLALTAASLAQSFQPQATWTNQHGSTLTIAAIAPDGSFAGSFVSHSGGECLNSAYPVRGWIDGQKIAFAVRWVNASDDCEALTSWTGYLGPKGVVARWVIVHFNRSGKPTLSSGTDVFH
jgi:hypothetical protein